MLSSQRTKTVTGLLKAFKSLSTPDFRTLWFGMLFNAASIQVDIVSNFYYERISISPSYLRDTTRGGSGIEKEYACISVYITLLSGEGGSQSMQRLCEQPVWIQIYTAFHFVYSSENRKRSSSL